VDFSYQEPARLEPHFLRAQAILRQCEEMSWAGASSPISLWSGVDLNFTACLPAPTTIMLRWK
jgi:hypothetical protein